MTSDEFIYDFGILKLELGADPTGARGQENRPEIRLCVPSGTPLSLNQIELLRT